MDHICIRYAAEETMPNASSMVGPGNSQDGGGGSSTEAGSSQAEFVYTSPFKPNSQTPRSTVLTKKGGV